MTNQYFAQCAINLSDQWGKLSDPLYAVGGTSADIELLKQCVTEPETVMLPKTRVRLNILVKQALSIPCLSPSLMEAMMSDSTLQTSLTREMLIEAYARKYAAELPAKAAMAPTTQWFRNLFAHGAPKHGQKYPRMCIVFQELYDSLRTDNPSPTPAIGAENAQKTAISIHPYRNGVVVALLFFFGLAANAQVQPIPGKWVSAHIAHVGEIVDTIRQAVTVSRWYTNCRDCDSFCIITNPIGQKCVWKVKEGRTHNGTQPVEWRNGAWWYSVAPGSGQRWEVELLFEPVTNTKP